MHGIRALLICVGLGLILGHGLGYVMAEFYWHTDGKGRGITYLFYEFLGLAVGVITGFIALALALTREKPAQTETGNGLTKTP